MRGTKIIAVLMVSVLVLGVVQSLPVWAGVNESEGFGVLPHAAGAVAGGIAGFFAGGILGAVVGAGFMAVVPPSQGCAGCWDIGSPIVY